LKAGLEAESDVAVVFGAEVSGAAIAQLVAFGSKLPARPKYMAWAITPFAPALRIWRVLPDRLPGYAYVGNPHAHESLRSCGLRADSNEAGLTAPQMWKRRSGKIEGAVRGGREIRGHISAREFGARHTRAADRA